jgi:hypothetical protein
MTNEPALADFTSPVVEVRGALVRPGELLVDIGAEAALADRLSSLNASGQPYSPSGDHWRENPNGLRYGDINARLEQAGTRLWHGLPPTLLTEVVDELPGVAFNHVLVGEDFYHGGPGGPPWPVPPPPEGTLPAYTGTTDAVDIAVLDNGLPADWAMWHARLVGIVSKDDLPPITRNRLNEDGDGRLDEQAGHGLFICGLIARVAPSLGIRLHRVLHSTGEGDEALVIDSLNMVLGTTARVVNLSFGAYTAGDREPAMAVAVRRLLDAGKVVVAAAGNAGDLPCFTNRPFFPAAIPGVIAVGAYAPAPGSLAIPGSKWDKSNGADVYAAGVDLYGEYVVWHSAQAEQREFDGYARWSGTSFAAPLVAAQLATAPNAAQWLAGLTPVDWPTAPGHAGQPALAVPPPLDLTGW